MFFTSLLLSIAVSIDALGIGITYGIRNTKISNISKYVLFFIFFIVAVLSTYFGSLLNNLFSPFVSNFIGFIILVFMGLWIIYTTITPKKLNKSKPKNKKYDFILKPLGITITIIKDPILSDLDNSNNISPKEAFYLAIALSLDVFSVGLGAGVSGITSLIFPLLSASFQVLFISLGSMFGKYIYNRFKISEKFWNVLSAIILIVIGFSRIFL